MKIKIKKCFLAILSFMMLCIMAPGHIAQAAPDVTVKVDGQYVSFPDQKPYIDSANRTMVPVRAPMEAMGCTVEWNDKTRQATITKGDKTAVFTIGKNTYTVNGQTKTMDTKAVIVGNRTAFPIRFAAEAMGATVDWDANTYTVLITTGGATAEVIDLGTTREKVIPAAGGYKISVHPVGNDFWFGISDRGDLKDIRVVCTSHPEWNQNNRLMWDGSRMVMPQDVWTNCFKFFKDGYSPVEPKAGDKVTFDIYGKVNGQEVKLVTINKVLQ